MLPREGCRYRVPEGMLDSGPNHIEWPLMIVLPLRRGELRCSLRLYPSHRISSRFILVALLKPRAPLYASLCYAEQELLPCLWSDLCDASGTIAIGELKASLVIRRRTSPRSRAKLIESVQYAVRQCRNTVWLPFRDVRYYNMCGVSICDKMAGDSSP